MTNTKYRTREAETNTNTNWQLLTRASWFYPRIRWQWIWAACRQNPTSRRLRGYEDSRAKRQNDPSPRAVFQHERFPSRSDSVYEKRDLFPVGSQPELCSHKVEPVLQVYIKLKTRYGPRWMKGKYLCIRIASLPSLQRHIFKVFRAFNRLCRTEKMTYKTSSDRFYRDLTVTLNKRIQTQTRTHTTCWRRNEGTST